MTAYRTALIVVLQIMFVNGCSVNSGAERRGGAASKPIPTPRGLRACVSTEPVATMLATVASQIGVYLGCFVTDQQVQLRSAAKTLNQPLEYAYAVRFPNGPYATKDLETLYAAVTKQWADFKPLDTEARDIYNEKLNQILASIIGSQPSSVQLSAEVPILVKIERVEPRAYVVLTIRRRHVLLADEDYASTAVDATAIVLRGNSMVRISLVKEFQKPSDIQELSGEINEWLRAVAKTG